MKAIVDTFGSTESDVDHDWGSWNTVKDPDSIAIDERICMNCGHREYRKAALGPYERH